MDEKVIFESLISIKRAGADMIITYFAKELPALIEQYEG
jgi:porphobilinogen synthase